MDKKAVIAATTTLVALYLLFLVQTSIANPIIIVDCPTIQIESPYHQAYCTTNLNLTFWTSTTTRNGPLATGIIQFSNASYSLDGKTLETVHGYQPGVHYSFPLTNLSEGKHTITVTTTVSANKTALEIPPVSYWASVYWTGPSVISDSVTFTVDTVGPKLVFVQPQNKTFNTNTVALNFTSEEPISKLSFSLDNGNNQTLDSTVSAIYGKDYYQLTLTHIKEGNHTLNVYACDMNGNIGKSVYYFTVNAQPAPSYTSTLTASLAESASALNFGNTINFTVNVAGGQAPYTYSWFLDNQSVQNGTSPTYSTNMQAVGSHHMYVQVTDANNSTAKTLTVEFTVLPYSNPSLSMPSSPTPEPTIIVDNFPPYHLIGVGIIAIIAVIAAIAVYLRKENSRPTGID